MDAVLQCTRAGCYLPGCCFYSGDQRMCDRTFHSCYGSPVEPHWKSGYPVPDTDRRDRTDRTGEYDIHQLRRKISLKNRRIIKESYNLDEMGGVVAVVRSVVKCVFLAEGIGAVLYAFCFVPEFGIKKVWCMPYFWRYLHSATQGSIFSGKQAFRYM